ncbi:hypothetical protein GTU79_10410 [Sodalis ligni]|nr:hypothetical protein [Sodalis ligni]QWA13036.1 hypothetical protein GTU79_10410 [Sodalis ligni]
MLPVMRVVILKTTLPAEKLSALNKITLLGLGHAAGAAVKRVPDHRLLLANDFPDQYTLLPDLFYPGKKIYAGTDKVTRAGKLRYDRIYAGGAGIIIYLAGFIGYR